MRCNDSNKSFWLQTSHWGPWEAYTRCVSQKGDSRWQKFTPVSMDGGQLHTHSRISVIVPANQALSPGKIFLLYSNSDRPNRSGSVELQDSERFGGSAERSINRTKTKSKTEPEPNQNRTSFSFTAIVTDRTIRVRSNFKVRKGSVIRPNHIVRWTEPKPNPKPN